MTELKKDMALMEEYKLTAEMLFVLKLLFEVHDAIETSDSSSLYESKTRFNSFFHEKFNTINQLDTIHALEERNILVKTEIPKSITFVDAEKLTFNKNFLKRFRRFSFEMGSELWDVYPKLGYVNDKEIPLTSLKTFNSCDELYSYYAKSIKYDEEKHRNILRLIEWAKDTGNSFVNMNIEAFVKGRVWEAISEFQDSGDTSYETKINEYSQWV